MHGTTSPLRPTCRTGMRSRACSLTWAWACTLLPEFLRGASGNGPGGRIRPTGIGFVQVSLNMSSAYCSKKLAQSATAFCFVNRDPLGGMYNGQVHGRRSSAEEDRRGFPSSRYVDARPKETFRVQVLLSL